MAFKYFRAILSVMIGLIVFFMGLLVWDGHSSPMTREKALKLIDNAGGLQKINQEASSLFEREGTNYFYLLTKDDQTNYPAMMSLGKSASYVGSHPGSAPEITISLGGLFNNQCFFIFPPNIDLSKVSPCYNWSQLKESPSAIQIATNIFATK